MFSQSFRPVSANSIEGDEVVKMLIDDIRVLNPERFEYQKCIGSANLIIDSLNNIYIQIEGVYNPANPEEEIDLDTYEYKQSIAEDICHSIYIQNDRFFYDITDEFGCVSGGVNPDTKLFIVAKARDGYLDVLGDLIDEKKKYLSIINDESLSDDEMEDMMEGLYRFGSLPVIKSRQKSARF